MGINDYNSYVEAYWRFSESRIGYRDDDGPNNWTFYETSTPVNYTSSKPATLFTNAALMENNGFQTTNALTNYATGTPRLYSMWLYLEPSIISKDIFKISTVHPFGCSISYVNN